MITLAASATCAQLQRARLELHPQLSEDGWLRSWLRETARHGRLARVDVDELADVVTEIARWRESHEIAGADLAPLGEHTVGSGSEQRNLRARLARAAGRELGHELGIA